MPSFPISPTSSSSPERFYLPDTLANWPWPRALNSAYAECKAASAAWCEKYKAFSPKAQRAFNLCDFNLLASLAYASLPGNVNRVGCDLMNLFFVYDEHSDAMDGDSVSVWAEIIMDALRNPHKPRPKGEPIVGEITRTYWINAMKALGPTAQRRFIDTFNTYTQSVVVQAEDRDHHVFRDVESYMEVRRDTIGAKPSFALLEHDMELPDEVFDHSLLQNLRTWCIDMLILGNDLCSYNVEQSRGDDGHNIVTLIMLQENIDLHSAMRYISDMHDGLADNFLPKYKSMPSFGQPIDEWVTRYIDGLGNWVRANDSWSFESWRYFKGEGLRIQKERWLELLPPADKNELTSSIPPESRWIQPAVIRGRPRPDNVGIVAMEVYVPQRCVAARDLEELDDVYPGKYTVDLGQEYVSVLSEGDNISSVAVKTVSSLITKYSIDPRSIGRLDICTETTTNESIKSSLINLFASVGNMDIEGVGSNQSTVGLFNAVNWVESSSWDGRYAIVFVGDIAASAQGRPSIASGTGACAMLIGPQAPIIVEPTHGTYVADVSDAGEVKVDSEDSDPEIIFTSHQYMMALVQSYTHYRNKFPKHNKAAGTNGVNGASLVSEFSVSSFDFMVLHAPFRQMVTRAYAKLLSTEVASHAASRNVNGLFDKSVSPSMLLANKCGNLGGGSIYGGLAALLTTVDAHVLQGKRIGVFGFGGGMGAFFGLRVVGDCSIVSKRMELRQRLDTMEVISVAQLVRGY